MEQFNLTNTELDIKLYPYLRKEASSTIASVSDLTVEGGDVYALATSIHYHEKLELPSVEELNELLKFQITQNNFESIDKLYTQSTEFLHSNVSDKVLRSILYLATAYKLCSNFKRQDEIQVKIISNLTKLLKELAEQLRSASRGESLLHRLAILGNSCIFEFVFKYFPEYKETNNINATFGISTKETPLHIAASRGYEDICQLLLSYGADINVGRNGICARTVLHVASEAGHEAVVCLFLAEPRIHDILDMPQGDLSRDRGYTALHLAAKKGHLSILRKLIEHGANPEVMDFSLKRTPVEVLVEIESHDLVAQDKMACILLDELEKRGSLFFNRIHERMIINSIKHGLVVTAQRLIMNSSFRQNLRGYSKSFLEMTADFLNKIATVNSNQNIMVEDSPLTYSHLIDMSYWYTAEDINQLLNAQVRDGQEAHVSAPCCPLLSVTAGVSAKSFQEVLIKAFGEYLPSLIPLNLTENTTTDSYGLSAQLVGSHWIGLFIKPLAGEGDYSHKIILVDSLGNGLNDIKDISELNLDAIRQTVPSGHAFEKTWESISLICNLIRTTIESQNLKVKPKIIITGKIQQHSNSDCGPMVVQNLVNLLLRNELCQLTGMEIRKSHASLLNGLFSSPRNKLAAYVQLIIWLIEQGADPAEKFTNPECYLIHIASQAGCYSLVDYLLNKGIDLSLRDRIGYTALHSAVGCRRRDCVDIVNLLLRKEPELLTLENNDGQLALHLAAQYGNQSSVQALLNLSSVTQVNQHDHKGNTPLHKVLFAIQFLEYRTRELQDYISIVVSLLQAQADVNATNLEGKSCLTLASDSGEERIIKVLNTHISPAEILQSKLNMLVGKLRQQEQFGIDINEQQYYIAVKGCWHNIYTNSFELYNEASDTPGEVNKFLNNDKKLFLLLGNAGAGKTMFCQYIYLKLKAQYQQPKDPIILYIMLGAMEDPSNHLIEKHLMRVLPGITAEEVESLKKCQSFIFILDGYDEISKGLYQNIYAMNKLWEWNAKVIISCRSTYLLNITDYRRHFYPFHQGKAEPYHFIEANLVPFSDDQIDAYIVKFLKSPPEELSLDSKWSEPAIYRKYIDQLPGLRVLLTTPFLLRVLMEVLPTVVKTYENVSADKQLILTEAKLYDYFVDGYFERQANKLAARGRLPDDGSDIIVEFQAFSKELAMRMWRKKLTYVTYKPMSTLLPSANENPWEDLLGNRNKAMVKVREGCPLKHLSNERTKETQFSFLNYILQIYFVSKVMFEEELSLKRAPIKVAPSEARAGNFANGTQFFTVSTSAASVATDESLPPLMSDEQFVNQRWVHIKTEVKHLAHTHKGYLSSRQGELLTITLPIIEEPEAWNNLQQGLEALRGYINEAMGIWIKSTRIHKNELCIQGKTAKSIDDIIAVLQEVGLEFLYSCQLERRI